MARFIGLETGSELLSVGFFEDSKPIAIHEYYTDKLHQRLLTATIAQMLENLQWSPSDIDAVGVSIGPGSYTGLRVGVAAAKGFSFARQIPLISISTLQALSIQWKGDSSFLYHCPMLDAGRDEVYMAIYDSEGSEVLKPHPRIIDQNFFYDISLESERQITEKNMAFIGVGAKKVGRLLPETLNLNIQDSIKPSVSSFGSLLNDSFIKKEFIELYEFEPLYLKDVLIRAAKSPL